MAPARRSLLGRLKSLISAETLLQFVKVVLSGGAATVLYFALLNLVRFGVGWSSFWSVTVAFVAATLVNYLLNRRWSFRLSFKVNPCETAAFFLINMSAWAITVLIVQVSESLFGPLGPLGLNLTNLVADGILIVPKFLAYKHMVFKRSLKETATTSATQEPLPTDSPGPLPTAET